MIVRPATFACWLVASVAVAQASPAAGDADPPTVASIVRALRGIEAVTRTLAIDVSIEVLELDGREIDPPARAAVSWKVRAGRSLTEVNGVDLDEGLRGADAGVAAHRARLRLPGGVTEALDFGTGAFTRDQRTYFDAATVSSDAGVNEIWWSFCGSRRSEILERRAAKITAVTRTPSGRCVEVTADDAAGRQRIVFECNEAWGFLPAKCRMLVKHEGSWIELRTIEVQRVRHTRLGPAPECASLVALRPAAQGSPVPGGFRRLRARYAFGAPEFANVLVPESLSGWAPESRPDPAATNAPALFREPVASRGHDLDGLLAQVTPFLPRSVAGAGRERPGYRVGAAFGAIALVAGVAGMRLARAFLMATGACVGMAALAAVLIQTAIDVRPADPDAHEAIVRSPLPGAKAPPRAKVLCGVDCLYLALRLARAPDPDYARLLRLIRPGTHGTTLETLRVVSECLALRAELVNPRRFDRPPEILIAHVAPSHFVVVTPLEAGAVAILDPGRGAFRGEWEAVRGHLSPVALALQGRVAS